MSWESILKGLTVAITSLALALLVKWVTIPANVTYLYTEADHNSTNTVCLWGYRPWHNDLKYFCSDDMAKVLDAMNKVNASRGK